MTEPTAKKMLTTVISTNRGVESILKK